MINQVEMDELVRVAKEKRAALAKLRQQKSRPSSNGSGTTAASCPEKCPHCQQEIEPIRFKIGQTERVFRPPVCSCAEAKAEMAAQIRADEMASWRSQALDLLRRAELESPRYGDKRFATWQDERNGGQAGVAREMVEAYVDTVALKSENWAVIHGGYGTGKTHLAIAAIRKLTAQNLWRSYIINWPEVNAETRELWGTKSGKEAAIWSKAREARLLLIDDLDKTKTDQLSIEKLYTVVNARYDRQAPTVITMNRSLEALKSLWLNGEPHLQDTGTAILDRIEGQLMAEIAFAGESQRSI